MLKKIYDLEGVKLKDKLLFANLVKYLEKINMLCYTNLDKKLPLLQIEYPTQNNISFVTKDGSKFSGNLQDIAAGMFPVTEEGKIICYVILLKEAENVNSDLAFIHEMLHVLSTENTSICKEIQMFKTGIDYFKLENKDIELIAVNEAITEYLANYLYAKIYPEKKKKIFASTLYEDTVKLINLVFKDKKEELLKAYLTHNSKFIFKELNENLGTTTNQTKKYIKFIQDYNYEEENTYQNSLYYDLVNYLLTYYFVVNKVGGDYDEFTKGLNLF